MKEFLNKRAKQLKADIPAVFLAMQDSKTPVLAKIFGFLTIVYAFSPIDFIPDFIPVLGYLDDVLILPLLVVLTIHFIPKEIMDSCRERAKTLWENGRPKKWYYAIPMVIIWACIIGYLLLLVL